MPDIDADRQSFRAAAARLTIYPAGMADAVIDGADDSRWGFVIVFGSTARGDGSKISDIDVYAEPIGSEVDEAWLLHFRDRMRAYNVDFVIPQGQSLRDRLAAGDGFAKQMLREALVLSDHADVVDGLRDRYLS